MFRKILKALFIIQTVSNKGRDKKLGKGNSKAYRLNPFNPLSYIVAISVLVIGILVFGFVGFWEETDGNPFKWN